MTKAGGEFAPWLGVFETLRVIDGVPLFLAEHRRELGRAMSTLGLESDFDFEQARAGLPRLSGRWRWIVTAEGACAKFSEEGPMEPGPVSLSVSPVRVGTSNWDARFKTLSYLSHAQAWKMKMTEEVILLNEYGHMASAARANLFWSLRGQLYTPAHEAGCRRGVVRAFVSKRRSVKSGHYPPSDLLDAEEVFLTNSMKGIIPVASIKGRDFRRCPIADELRAEYEEEIAEQVAAGQAGA